MSWRRVEDLVCFLFGFAGLRSLIEGVGMIKALFELGLRVWERGRFVVLSTRNQPTRCLSFNLRQTGLTPPHFFQKPQGCCFGASASPGPSGLSRRHGPEVYQDLRSVFNCAANQLCGTCVLDVMEAPLLCGWSCLWSWSWVCAA